MPFVKLFDFFLTYGTVSKDKSGYIRTNIKKKSTKNSHLATYKFTKIFFTKILFYSKSKILQNFYKSYTNLELCGI